MRRLITAATALSFVCLPVLAAQQSGQAGLARQATQEKQEPKAETKAAPSVAGKWTMSIDMQNGAQTPTVEFKQDGKKVTGTLFGPQGDIALAGEYADGKLTFSITFQGNTGEIQIAFAGAMKADGTLAGTFSARENEIPWTATRVKDK